MSKKKKKVEALRPGTYKVEVELTVADYPGNTVSLVGKVAKGVHKGQHIEMSEINEQNGEA